VEVYGVGLAGNGERDGEVPSDTGGDMSSADARENMLAKVLVSVSFQWRLTLHELSLCWRVFCASLRVKEKAKVVCRKPRIVARIIRVEGRNVSE